MTTTQRREKEDPSLFVTTFAPRRFIVPDHHLGSSEEGDREKEKERLRVFTYPELQCNRTHVLS